MKKVMIHSMQRLHPVVVFCVLSSGVHADALNRCARYGADFAPVAGSNGCVRLGGHVRVGQVRGEPDPAQPPAPMLPPMSYVARDGMQPASARVAQQPMAPFELFRR